MAISSTSSVKEVDGAWVIEEAAKLPGAEMLDVTTVDKGTLAVRKRTIKQGPVAIDLAFKDGKVAGSMGMGGQNRPVAADLGGEIFADGASTGEALAHLPLAEGYAVTFRVFDPMKMKAAFKTAKVLGAEEVKVPAGAFQAWKVEVASAEGEPGTTTLWIDKASRRVVKTATVIPQMGGATLTTELQP